MGRKPTPDDNHFWPSIWSMVIIILLLHTIAKTYPALILVGLTNWLEPLSLVSCLWLRRGALIRRCGEAETRVRCEFSPCTIFSFTPLYLLSGLSFVPLSNNIYYYYNNYELSHSREDSVL